MARSTAVILTRIESLLSKPERWTKGEMARTKPGDPEQDVSPHAERATCFCLLGAKTRILGPDVPVGDALHRDVRNRLGIAAHALFPDRCASWQSSGPRVAEFNDHPDTTLEDVLAVIRHARSIT